MGTPRHRARGVSALTAICVALGAGGTARLAFPAAFAAPQIAGLAGRVSAGPVQRSRLLSKAKIARFAEDAEHTEAAHRQNSTSLFQELVVTNKTTDKSLMGAIVGAFTAGEKAVDLVLIDPRCKHKLIYALARLPDAFGAGAQVQMRRRDRRLRVRVIKQFPYPVLDSTPEVLRVAGNTNATALGNRVKSTFVDIVGNNLEKQRVQLKFAGAEAASIAIVAIEMASRFAYRELTFSASFEEGVAQSKEGDTAEGSQGKVVSIALTVTAT